MLNLMLLIFLVEFIFIELLQTDLLKLKKVVVEIANYLIENIGENGIIRHCAYHANDPNPDYWDSATIWGDYYFLEALNRLKEY